MSGTETKPVFEVWLLKDLKEFPMQREFFPEPLEEEIDALAEDIEINGLKCPVEILPENAAGYPPGAALSDRRSHLVRALNSGCRSSHFSMIQ